MQWFRWFSILLVGLSACGPIAPATIPSPTTTPTNTPSATASPTATPSATATATQTPTITPTATVTPSPTITPTPSLTPQPFNAFSYDNWQLVSVPPELADGLDSALLVFINSNDQVNIRNLATAQPATGMETVYFASPTNPSNRIPILELNSATEDQVYVSPIGNGIAYLQTLNAEPGLYVLNMENGLSARIVPLTSLVQRGFFSEPQWSPNGDELALALATGYDLDIFIYAYDGSRFQNLTNQGSYDWWPVWSPDGTKLAFVSDRQTCPSWIPGEPNACDSLTTPPPIGGHVYIYDWATGETTLVSDVFVTEPPKWLNNVQLSFAGGDPLDLLNPTRTLWLANIATGAVRQVILEGDTADTYYLSETWSPDGRLVLFQRANITTDHILMRADGSIVRQRDDLSFPRFAMAASWSPDSQRLAVGGVNGQCPYGIRVTDAEFSFVATGNPPPSMCNPIFSPDGQFIAFLGINPRGDGRADIYTTNANGFGAVNLTADLQGNLQLIGWVAPRR